MRDTPAATDPPREKNRRRVCRRANGTGSARAGDADADAVRDRSTSLGRYISAPRRRALRPPPPRCPPKKRFSAAAPPFRGEPLRSAHTRSLAGARAPRDVHPTRTVRRSKERPQSTVAGIHRHKTVRKRVSEGKSVHVGSRGGNNAGLKRAGYAPNGNEICRLNYRTRENTKSVQKSTSTNVITANPREITF